MIKCYRAVESCSISLPSVLRVQLNHAKHLCENWINPGMILTSPEDTGIWTLDQSLYSPVLQVKDDELYTVSINILHGCACRTDCKTGRSSCDRKELFSRAFGLNCSRWTCKYGCFDKGPSSS